MSQTNTPAQRASLKRTRPDLYGHAHLQRPPTAPAGACMETYANLRPAQRAQLKKNDPELFERLRAQQQAQADEVDIGSRSYAQLKPLEKARLKRQDPDKFQRLRREAGLT